MTVKRFALALATLAVTCTASAQSNAGKAFDDYRKSMLQGYKDYRSNVLSNYAKFLNGVWDNYEQFKAQERDPSPKPQTVPDVAEMPPLPIPGIDQPIDEPAPDVAQQEQPTDQPEADQPAQAAKPRDKVEGSKAGHPGFLPNSPSAKPMLPDLPKVAYTPREFHPAEEEPLPAAQSFAFDFYEIPMQVPQIDFDIHNNLASPNDYANQWTSLAASKQANQLVDMLSQQAKAMGLNDYLTYELAKSYVKAKFPNADASARLSLVHYLLANMGYDVRIATSQGTTPLLLMTFEQMVYARPFLRIDGKKYFIFPDDDAILKTCTSGVATCRLPKDADLGKVMDLRLNNLNLPYKAHPYEVTFGGITIKGETNAYMFPLVYRYPQMPISDYAQSTLDPKTRNEVVSQVTSQLQGMEQKAAVNKLLHFVQKGFKYATDDVAHGFEKPYFFEEVLYHPTCDCEDRAVFYTYLLWNALGVENHIINYPGHESVAVTLTEPVNGSGYEYDGSMFNISDPTYIGSNTGMCMPSFAKTTPEVDYIYR